MNTDAVMCMALTSARPSRTPLSLKGASTCGVMLRNARRPGVSNQSSLRYDFTIFRLNAQANGQNLPLCARIRASRQGRIPAVRGRLLEVWSRPLTDIPRTTNDDLDRP